MQRVWSGFYRKALKERQQQLKLAFPSIFSTKQDRTKQNAELNSDSSDDLGVAQPTSVGFPLCPIHEDIADNMIENCVGWVVLVEFAHRFVH